MKILLVVALTTFVGWASASEDARPTFAEPVFQPSANCPLNLSGTLSPQNQILSILRVAKSTNDPNFLTVGAGYPKDAKAFCAMEIRLAKPLAKAEQLSIDMRGAESKEADTVLSFALRIDSREHKSEYARGRWLENLGSEAKRYLVTLKPGTAVVRLALFGAAKSYNGKATTYYAFDSLDLCFVDPEQPELCGPGVPPSQPAAPASAPG